MPISWTGPQAPVKAIYCEKPIDLDLERRNFIGAKERVLAAEERQWAARSRPGDDAGRSDRDNTTSQ